MQNELKPLELQEQQLNQTVDNKRPIERVKNNLYAGIKVSIRTMDLIIASISILLIITLFIGIFSARF